MAASFTDTCQRNPKVTEKETGEDGYKVDDIIKDVQSCLEPYMFPVEILAIDERPFFHFKTNRIELSKELKKKNHDC